MYLITGSITKQDALHYLDVYTHEPTSTMNIS